MSAANRTTEGPTLRQAALIAGFGTLLMAATAPFAEFFVFPKLIVHGDIEQSIRNIIAHRTLYLAGVFGYLINFVCDIVIAWALYILLVPVNRSLSLLAAWFRLIYTAIAVVALFKLVAVFRLLNTPDYSSAQIRFLLDSFRWDWSTSLMLFDIHLGLLGWLVYRSGYIPRLLGILLAIDALGWLIDGLSPYFYPHAWLGFVSVTSLGELFFMLWLLIRGGKIQPSVP
jgi:hypothetical protein